MLKTKEMQVSPKEMALILALRGRFAHGEVVVMMRDGSPQYIKRAWENDVLSTDVDEMKGR